MNEDLNIDDIKLWSIMIESHFLIQHKKFIEVKALIFGVANWNHPHSSSFRMPLLIDVERFYEESFSSFPSWTHASESFSWN